MDSSSTVIFIEDEQQQQQQNHNIPTTADELIAEAFLRCARMRTIFTVWKAKSQDAITRSKVENQVATIFRDKYLIWSSLQKWRNKAEEQGRLSSMSLIAWGWHTKRSQRKVLSTWRTFIEENKIRKLRNLDFLEGIRYEAENNSRLRSFFTWMGFASRGSVATTFRQLRTNNVTKRRVFAQWKAKLHKRQRQQLIVQFHQSRIQLENVLRFYDRWFLHSFCARHKERVLDCRGRLDAIAQSFYHRRILLTNCLIGKWVPRYHNSIADRFHRQHQQSMCFSKLKTQFTTHKSLRLRRENFQEKRNINQLEKLFSTWKHRATIQSVFSKIIQERNLKQKKHVLSVFKQRLQDRREEQKWKLIGVQVRREFVLKRGFETLLETSSKLSWKQHQQSGESKKKNSIIASSTGNVTTLNNNNTADNEASIRSLLSSFRDLMLTNGADIQIVSDNEIPDHSSVKKSAIERMKERERLRATIMQLRQNL